MNTTQTSFFIRDCSRGEFAALPVKTSAGELSRRLYHTLAAANESFEQATRRLLRLAESAHGARNYAALGEISQALQAIPFAPAHRAADYYQALVIKHTGQLDHAAELLGTVDAPRAMQTLATIREAKGDFEEAARLHVEALRQARAGDPLTVINAGIQLATIKAISGDNRGALADLQALAPMVRTFGRQWPHVFFQLQNELAVELQATGQKEAARQAVAVALASPVAPAYPEWQETADELREPEAAPVAVVVVEPERKEKQKPVISDLSLVTRHLSLITHRRSAVGGQRSAPKVSFIRTRANPRASPRAPPSEFISSAN